MDIISTEQLKLIENVDFETGCEFIDGQCREVRLGRPRLYCCNECAKHVGYLKVKEHELPEEYKNLFDEEKGFLGENGCKLPKEKRSVTCVCYACKPCNILDSDRTLLVQVKRM